MHTILQPLFVIALFVLVRAGDLAISAGIARSTIRAVCYGIVAILALIVLLLAILGMQQ